MKPHLVECQCAECRRLDKLPEDLQGIPGAKQLTFIAPMTVGIKKTVEALEEDEALDPNAVVRPLL